MNEGLGVATSLRREVACLVSIGAEEGGCFCCCCCCCGCSALLALQPEFVELVLGQCGRQKLDQSERTGEEGVISLRRSFCTPSRKRT
jgi:hypothetical protein